MDPIVLFFALGLIAGLAKSDLRVPAAVYELLSILLLLTIGLKGGVELAKTSLLAVLPQMIAVLAMGFVLPLLLYPIGRLLGRLNRADAGSLAAHYGSVSVATFAVGVAFLAEKNVEYDSQLPLFLVLLEIPAILVGIILAKGLRQQSNWPALLHDVFFGKSILLLVGGLLIGWIAGAEGLSSIEPLFFDLFKGILALFLMEMGLIASLQLGALRKTGLFLVLFGILAPLPMGAIGALVGLSLGLSVGGTMLLATLAGSASYIAAPAAIRIAVPDANPSLSLTASLGVTFPFNIFVGIPAYFALANALHRWMG